MKEGSRLLSEAAEREVGKRESILCEGTSDREGSMLSNWSDNSGSRY